MKETPMLMCGEMVVATLADIKTEMRRVVRIGELIVDELRVESRKEAKGNLIYDLESAVVDGPNALSSGQYLHVPFRHKDDPEDGCRARVYCPYGDPGDRLWVRETHYRWGRKRQRWSARTGRLEWYFKAHPWRGKGPGIRRCVAEPLPFTPARKRTELGWHKRPSIFMDKIAARIWLEIVSVRVERVQEISIADALAEGMPTYDENETMRHPHEEYMVLWNKLNEQRGFGWDKNPWVWVVGFRKLRDGELRVESRRGKGEGEKRWREQSHRTPNASRVT